MARGRAPRGGARGGDGIQASSQVRARLGAALASLLVAASVGAGIALSSDEHRGAVGGVALAALVVLALALARPFPSLVPWALVLLGAAYTWRLADGPLDEWAPIYAGGFVAVAELGYWSLELRGRAHEAARLIDRRAALIAAVALVGVAGAALVLAATAVGVGSGVASDLLGVAAAIGALAVVASLARRA
jgi:hypothetical protein